MIATAAASPGTRFAGRGSTLPSAGPAQGRTGAARPARGSGRTVRPTSRPVGSVSAPRMVGVASPSAASCSLAADSQWRLTDRGIAAILVMALMIVAAALMVVTMTAVRVTGDTYQPHRPGQSQPEL
jgi:hypothetical protein